MEKLSPLRLRLKQAIEWLKTNKNLQQKDIAQLMGMAEASFSRGLKRCNDRVDSDFVVKFHQATDGEFNLDWLLEGTEPMFADSADKGNSYQFTSTPVDMIELYAQRIRLVDDLRTSLKDELAEVRNLRVELQQVRDDFRDATYRLTLALRNIQEQKSVNIGFAAEP